MLKFTVVMGEDLFDDELQEFVEQERFTLELEHSLVTLSKWEAVWEKPYMGSEKKTTEEVMGYVKAMCLTPDVPPEVFQKLNAEHFAAINKYVDSKMSATWFNEKPAPGRKEIITSEIIYYWMISLNIPLECEHWHLNRLITLIKVCSQKNAPAKKMNKADMAAERHKLNAQRRAEHNTSG